MIRAASLALVVSTIAVVTPGPTTRDAPVPLVVTTLNVHETLGPARARHDLARAYVGSDLVLTQEMGRRRARDLIPDRFGVWQPRDAAQLAVAWRRSTLTFRGGVILLAHRSHLFRSATRYALAARFRTPAGRCLVAVDVHSIPHVEINGHPRRLPRITLVQKFTTRLRAFSTVVRAGCALIIGGDWNVDGYADRRVRYRYFPAVQLGALDSTWGLFPGRRGTLGARSVDGFYLDRLDALGFRVVGGTYSDHDAARVWVR